MSEQYPARLPKINFFKLNSPAINIKRFPVLKQSTDLTYGHIPQQIIKLSVPIMGTSFIQMAYSMIDMIWLGRVGSDAVAAVGAATFFTWLGISLMLITRTGAEVGVSQSLGSGDNKRAISFAQQSLTGALVLAILYGILTYIFAPGLIGFFKLTNTDVNHNAVSYLRIISAGSLLYYSNPTFSGVFNGAGNSKLPFRINSIGLMLNIVADPLLIFGVGPIPQMGSDGAAYATVASQGLVLLLFIIRIKKGKSPLKKASILSGLDLPYMRKIFKLGLPVAMQSILFAIFAMILARIVGRWGALPIAVQSVGAQIEALSWMTASGFATALGAFVGQNFGAAKWERIYKGFLITVGLSSVVGFIVGILFVGFGQQVFGIFIPEPDAIQMGGKYLEILGYSQIFMCMEIATSGAFNGIGRTMPPSIIGITLTGMRIPLALVLALGTSLGLLGVWWSLSLTSILKGIILFVWFYRLATKHPDNLAMQGRPLQFIRLIPNRIRQQFLGIKTK